MMGDWKECLLGDVVTLKRGYDLPEHVRVPGDVPVVSSSGVTGYHDQAKVCGPGVVTGRYGTLGAVFFIRSDFWPLNTSLYVVDFKGNDPCFISYFLRTVGLGRQNVAGAVPGINRNYLHRLRVCVPGIALQRKIASVLCTYDDFIENNLRRIRILEEMARLLYQGWFVKFRFGGHEKVRFVNSGQGKLPVGWDLRSLEDLAQERRCPVEPNEVDPDTPYVGLEHLPRRSLALGEWGKASDVQSLKHEFRKGQILFGKIRPYFHKVAVAPVDGVCSSDAIVITVKDPKWFGLVLSCVSSDEFIAHASKTSNGTKMPRANWDVLLKYTVAVPPKELLAEFNDFITAFVGLLQNLIFQNRNLRQTRDLLLPRLVSGEIDVSDLDIRVQGGAT